MLRCAGTKTSSSSNDRLPVPRRPSTSQSSTISISPHWHEQVTGWLVAGRILAARADDRPLRMQAAGGERKPPAQPPAARRRSRRFPGRQRGCGDRQRIIAPDVLLRLFRHAGDDPLVLAQHRVNPGAGGAALGQDFDDAGEHPETLPDGRRIVAAARPAGCRSGGYSAIVSAEHGAPPWSPPHAPPGREPWRGRHREKRSDVSVMPGSFGVRSDCQAADARPRQGQCEAGVMDDWQSRSRNITRRRPSLDPPPNPVVQPARVSP